jgi:Kef-type K+ transport system membrane component KefB
MAGPAPRPFLTAFICAAVAFCFPVITVLIAWGPPGNDGAFLLGFLFALTALPAVITGFLARRAKAAWSGKKIAVVYVIILIAVMLLYVIGKMPPRPQ